MAEEDQPDLEERTEMKGVLDVTVEITAVLGTSLMPISQILKLGRGAVVELDRYIGDDIELIANNIPVAKGEVTVLDDRLGVTMTEILKTAETVTK